MKFRAFLHSLHSQSQHLLEDDGSCDYSCCPGPGCCTDGMYWDWDLQGCFITNPTDTNLDGCTNLTDLMDILSAYGDCAMVETNYSLSFDGVDDYVDINSLSTNFSSYNDFSFHGFFRTNNSYLTGQELIFSTSDNSHDKATLWLGIKSDQILVQYFDGVSHSEYLYYGSNCSDNQWHSLGLVLDNQGEMFVYLDGIEVGHEYSIQIDFNFADYYSLGQEWDPSSTPSDFFIGNLDDISIWDIVLDSNHIQQYNSSSPNGDEEGLVGYWDFNEGTGSTLTDQTSNGNDGIINGATWSTDVPTAP